MLQEQMIKNSREYTEALIELMDMVIREEKYQRKLEMAFGHQEGEI